MKFNIKGLERSGYWQDDLIRSMSVPSVVHPYSLAIEYIKDRWFLPKFENEFKTVYVNGKHIFDDLRQFNDIKTHQISKPAVAITPKVDSDWNRDNIDLYQGGLSVYTVRNRRYDDRVLRDDTNNLHLSMHLGQLQMQFDFHVRVSSRAEQLNYMSRIRLACRIGSTQGEYIDMDFLLPKDVIIAVALDAGFVVKKLEDGTTEVDDVSRFIKYLNSISRFPITYKFRGITGSLEYFIRIPGNYAHISCLDGISYDDGERQGQLDNNFHIDFSVTLQIPMPTMYIYYSKIEHSIKRNDDSAIGLYQFTITGPPKKNDRGWSKWIESDYISDNLQLNDIPFMDIFDTVSDDNSVKISVMKVMEETIKSGLSPSIFLEVQIYNGQRPLHAYTDWENRVLRIDTKLNQQMSKVAIYADLGYVNNMVANINHLNESDNRIG